MWFKRRTAVLGDFEQLVLLGVLRLDEDAYGAAIRQEIHARSGRDVSINAVYTTRDRQGPRPHAPLDAGSGGRPSAASRLRRAWRGHWLRFARQALRKTP